MHRPTRTQRDWLAISATAFLAANLLHGADHLRQHLAGVDIEVFTGGGAITVAAIVTVIAARRRHPQAAQLCTALGFTAGILVAASHLAPHWSSLSDSYVNDIHPDVLSWIVVSLEIAAGFMLGFVGLARLRAPARAAGQSWPERAALTARTGEPQNS
jgi:zinc transporter ZupT